MTREDGLRASIYHRLHVLLPGVPERVLRGVWRVLVWGFWLVYFSFVIVVLVLRYSILPHIEDYRSDIERLTSQGLGQSISIGRIEASWQGINPDLTLFDVRVADAQGRPALAFTRIEAILSWWSVPNAQLELRLLSIDEPTLNLRRASDGHIFIAGIPLRQEQNDSDVSDWILGQRRIRIRGATLVWQDELRNAPALVLKNLDLALDNVGNRHRFGLTALPPEGLASKIDVRGDFRGTDIERMGTWSGQAYAEIAYADLAVWRQWLEYPVALPHGRGALRAWLGFARGSLREVTADLSLRDVSLRLAQDLPALELEQMSGRLGAKFSATGFEASGRQIELATRPLKARNGAAAEAIRIEATDFHVDWQPHADGKTVLGSASANRLDLGALARLAGYLPFDARSRQLLTDYAPHGQVSGLTAKWKGDADRLQAYSLKAGFDGLGLTAQGYFPGFSGLSGVLEANEAGGSATLRSKESTIDLPSIFPESLTTLDTLAAQATWKVGTGGIEAELSQVEFSGPDAAGSAQGSYRSTETGPGVIDLTASLTRADARAVWRYMPHAVGQGARLWLRDALLAGHASEAKLILKGDLIDFPFLDKSKGQFLVTVKAHDAVLDYATGWPRIEGIAGDLRFEGNGMVVEAQRGSILGAQLMNTRAEIPDFDAPISTLFVKGQVSGPTSEFLKFVEQSPVAERIDHFTDDLRASGNGHLDLGLVIPLDEARLGDSKIEGIYRLLNNEVTIDAALPPIKQVNGSVQFSGSDLKVPEITGTLFGGPLKIKGGLQKDGRVLIAANGSINFNQLRKPGDLPLLETLSGTTSYRGEVRINKRNADLVIGSTLLGLASTLPEPFAKTAGETVPLRFEKKLLPAGGRGDANASSEKNDTAVHDQISAALGNFLSVQLIRHKQHEGFVSERGAIAIGRPLQLPASGIALEVSAKRLDLDHWRRLLRPAGGAASEGAANVPSPTVDAVSIKADDLLLLGRHYNDVDLNASAALAQWKIRLASRQASGDLLWENAGSGKLTARFKQLTIDPAPDAGHAGAGEVVEKLPALDIIADEFALGTRRFGRLEVQARNEAGVWHLQKIQATNPFGSLSGSGQWHIAGGKNRTQLEFKVDSSDVGKLLERLAYPGAVRAGTAQLGGKIGWNSSPADLDFESLSGELNLEAGKGQFVKLDPGAAGKLLGLISLQGLPRRISLDFKDVFSEGLAFDTISSKVSVENGVMRTERLQIDGPSARVVMRGEVDLLHETQRLNVNVQPELGGTAALGIALINPIAGVATLLAHKVLQNPLNHMFGFDYRVTGTWDDPKVEKLSGNEPPVAAPRLPTISNSPGAH
ncbi:YhdP family protein [Propionivibrio sp.]|uniref:YhdP family protein n=1 Tax=Propionivibrio sp. TaxID=2212460 RepID=UPI00260A816D|nr:YhdP family protein [Propionivibrio sp.]